MTSYFELWLQRVPLVLPPFDGSFDRWYQLVPEIALGPSSANPIAFSGVGVATGAATLNALAGLIAAGPGISLGRAKLTPASSPASHARGTGVALGSARLSHFVAVVLGPAIPGYTSVQQALPQYVNWFGHTMMPLVDALKLRYVPLTYVSPPVCPPFTNQSGSSYQMIPAYL